MTTKAIRALIQRVKECSAEIGLGKVDWYNPGVMADKAFIEVDAIERACAFVVRESAITDVENEHVDVIRDIARDAP